MAVVSGKTKQGGCFKIIVADRQTDRIQKINKYTEMCTEYMLGKRGNTRNTRKINKNKIKNLPHALS